jgi:uncharacterized membrane protein
MTMTSTFAVPDRASRLLLIVSLALNLFFIGTIGALALRHYVTPAQPATTERTRTAAARIERLAAPLPPADAEKLRMAFRAQAAAAEGTRDALNRALEHLQRALRMQPFDPADVRAALLEIRTARPVYEQVMADIYLTAVAAMSQEGRVKLADWPPPRPVTNVR